MRKDIHPQLYELRVVMTNGKEFKTYSASSIGEIILESDRHNHPAWNPGLRDSGKKNSKAAKFNEKWGDLG